MKKCKYVVFPILSRMLYYCYLFPFLSDSTGSQLGSLKNALSYAAVEVKTVNPGRIPL